MVAFVNEDQIREIFSEIRKPVINSLGKLMDIGHNAVCVSVASSKFASESETALGVMTVDVVSGLRG